MGIPVAACAGLNESLGETQKQAGKPGRTIAYGFPEYQRAVRQAVSALRVAESLDDGVRRSAPVRARRGRSDRNASARSTASCGAERTAPSPSWQNAPRPARAATADET